MTTQAVILLCLVASYLFLQTCQPGMPAEEPRKGKARKKEKNKETKTQTMTTVSLKVGLFEGHLIPLRLIYQTTPPFC